MSNYIWDFDVITGEPVQLYIFELEPDEQEPDEQEPDELPL